MTKQIKIISIRNNIMIYRENEIIFIIMAADRLSVVVLAPKTFSAIVFAGAS